ncbi:thioredoxin family protein [Nocardia uniformis]|uniref:Thioredoxin family protein n=1 Tax=Nocardia uniformis TaxID=53432 RepID=A0A849C0R9_9NOCA|nr:thioredoxin family protein [Nocardia uniformis]NNH72363.1 thioredoxin family protein [Nocardia uniformis]
MSLRALSQHDFQQTVTSNHIVLVDFWAEWCGWCKRFAPVYQASAETHPQIVHATVDGDAEPALAGSIGLTGYPTIMAFREGLPVYKNAGYLDAGQLEEVVQQVLWMDMDEFRRQAAEQLQQQSGQRQAPTAEPAAAPIAHRAGPAPGPPQYGWPGLRTR